jgi:hypothetical protein
MEVVRGWKDAGWGIMQCEFRHNAFDPQMNEVAAKSRFYFSVHLTNEAPARVAIQGDLFVHWKMRMTDQAPAIQRIDASQLEILIHSGPPPFTPILVQTFDPPALSPGIEPLLVHDFDEDCVPEIVLPSYNRLYRRHGDEYRWEKFAAADRIQVLNGLFEDFDGDGLVDFLYVEFDGVFLLKGSAGGNFGGAPRPLTPKPADFFGPRTITCGDIDGDGDLDVFVGQYKQPFVAGTMPTPYYDANDGYPWRLFVNDGVGNLTDVTLESGLFGKRFRRVYAASLADLDGDDALDLLVTSDFAGVDLFRGDGRGKFVDVITTWAPERHLFGMGHAIADFNNDNVLDFYVTGMTSATADRLEHLGLHRPIARLSAEARSRMAGGSRLYLSTSNKWENAASVEWREVSRSGWSWGCSAADFDNDGWVDVYVANGMESLRHVQDYESEFWLHDIFVATAEFDSAVNAYFLSKGRRRVEGQQSFGGYDKNRLYLNLGGAGFRDVAHLFGVALEADSRSVVASDLNADGRPDLIVTTADGRTGRNGLVVFENRLVSSNNWVAVGLSEKTSKRPHVGTRVTIRFGDQLAARHIVTGDSYRGQHPSVVHFGLGSKIPEEIRVRLPGMEEIKIVRPAVNRVHQIRHGRKTAP